MTDVANLQQSTTEFSIAEQSFGWPQQAERERNWPEAARRWAVLRKAYPNHSAPWLQGANAHMEASDFEQAETLLTHARLHFPKNPNSLIFTAALAMHRQKWDAGERVLQEAREKHPNELQTWIKSAECAAQRGNIDQAKKYFQTVCQIAPDRPGPFIQLAELAMRTEQWEEALMAWEELRTRFPEVPAGYLRAAEAARRLGLPIQARQLTLTHQYGADIFDNIPTAQDATLQGDRHAKLGLLLELIWTKAIFQLRSEVNRNYLSYGWWVLEPLLYMIVYYLVFGIFLQRGGENYAAFLLTGLIPWMWSNKAVSGSSNSILAGQNLLLQVGLPSIVFPLVSQLQATLKHIPIFMLLFGFIWLQGYSIGFQWWALIPVIVVQALVTTAFACAVAAVVPFVRDLSYLVPTGLTLIMFMSGIFYDYQTISEKWQALFLLNPFAFLLKCYREIFVYGVLPDLVTLSFWGLGGAVACLLVMIIYKRLRYVYPRIILE